MQPPSKRHTTKAGDERLARLVMQTALDVPVAVYDDQSRDSMYDLRVLYPDGRVAAVEVVSTRSSKAVKLELAAQRLGHIPKPELSRSWQLLVVPETQLKKLAAAATAHLVELEHAGVERCTRRSQLPPALQALGVASVRSFPPTEQRPPGFRLNPLPTGAWEHSADDAVRECVEFLHATPDVLGKLLASGAPERHAVVIVTVDWLEAFAALRHGSTPTAAPDLPEGVECLWMIALKALPIRAIYWLGDGVWRDVLLDQEHINRANHRQGRRALYQDRQRAR
ncbi:hypothetical protein [Micromonospora sp. NBC_01796]|uniref:hypothetical protein n=1 Tax=Micromonospora sp. NBC_01796 TaxID=2975987 RepID=UPI002DD94720|nr:hypothetical protein [Micromonospora sp. NBC_01796]WSA86701.1 hypothetical protein OIE47_03485 [Micromonospora sp. NBC_01796]